MELTKASTNRRFDPFLPHSHMKSDDELDYLEGIEALIRNAKLSSLAEQYEACLKRRDVDIGFNLFEIISDFYYRENLHSDILKALLDPMGKHQAANGFLHLFLEYLQSLGVPVNISDYENAQVVREEGRIDILIKDEGTKKAIIIENKINGAGDRERQIPRYLQHVIDNGYMCDAVIYVRLNSFAFPDMTGWTKDEQERVKMLLWVVCAYNVTENDLLNGWILKCVNHARDSAKHDALHVLQQYGNLIKKLGINIMNIPIMEKFHKIMTEGDNLRNSMSLRAMMNELVAFRAARIVREFESRCEPFKPWVYDNISAIFSSWENCKGVTLDIGCQEEKYVMQFWDREFETHGTQRIVNVMASSTMKDKFTLINGHSRDGYFERTYRFPEDEHALYADLETFFQETKILNVFA